MKLSYPNLPMLHFQKIKSISISLSPQILRWRNFILKDQLVPTIPNHPTCNTKSVKIRRSHIFKGNLHCINKIDLLWLPKTIPKMSLHPNRLCKEHSQNKWLFISASSLHRAHEKELEIFLLKLRFIDTFFW